MSAHENARIARALYHRFNLRDFESGILLISPTAEWECVARGRVFRGPQGYRERLDAWMAAVPDLDFDVVDLVATEDRVAAEVVGMGTHSGWWEESGRALPPTGNAVRIAFCEFMRVDGRKVLASRVYFDRGEWVSQLVG